MCISVELILSIVLALSTIAYTIINGLMLRESQAVRRQKIAPLLVAYLRVTENSSFLCLHIKNVGEGYAKDVQAKVLKDHYRCDKQDYRISDYSIFKNGVNVFPAGYELKYHIAFLKDIDFSSENSFIELEFEYYDMHNRKITSGPFKLPLNQILASHSNPPDTYVGQIPYYLKKINETLKK